MVWTWNTTEPSGLAWIILCLWILNTPESWPPQPTLQMNPLLECCQAGREDPHHAVWGDVHVCRGENQFLDTTLLPLVELKWLNRRRPWYLRPSCTLILVSLWAAGNTSILIQHLFLICDAISDNCMWARVIILCFWCSCSCPKLMTVKIEYSKPLLCVRVSNWSILSYPAYRDLCCRIISTFASFCEPIVTLGCLPDFTRRQLLD